MRRVHVTTGTAADCTDALAGLDIAIDPATGAILSPTRLTVGFDPAGVTDDPCKPATHAGFLGADNQTFRVQITAPGRFIWGADNASPLYRVQALPFQEPGGGPATLQRIHFLTPPPDQAHYPLAGQAVELMRWGALLPNHEKVAEPTGMLATVQTGYDPDSQSIVIATPVPQAWVDWFTGAGAGALSDHDAPDDQQYFYLKLWSGGSGDAATPDTDFAANVARPLAGTGLTVTFSDAGRPGDYWIIAARPNTPDIVVPWALQQGLPPMGPLVFLTPLAIITWTLGPNEVPTPAVHDCRHRFRPLCETSCCCTITVGDGENSFGDVTSVETAVELLPDGGEICVLRGTYNETILIDGRNDITITGCGPDSLLTPADANAAVLTVRNSSDIHLRNLGFEALAAPAIHLDGTHDAPIRRAVLDGLAIRARDVAAVIGTGLRGIEMRCCDVDLLPLAVSLADNPAIGRQPAIYLAGDDLDVERCRVEVDAEAASARQPLGGVQIGGVQIGGGSRRIRLRDNLIRRGNGHGIILGSVRFVHARPNEVGGVVLDELVAAVPLSAGHGGPFTFIGLGLTIDDNGCISIDPDPPGDPGDGDPLVPVSEGALIDVAILDNKIEAMGVCGISVARFFDLSRTREYISIEGLEIAHNRIRDCVRLEAPLLSANLNVHSAIGGITLAHCERLTVRDNRIENCGRNPGDPVCGLFVLLADGAVVERNRITGNGASATATAPPRPGRRGGVVFALALPGSFPFTVPLLNRAGLRQDGAPALRVHDNVIVTPEGRALEVIAVGPVSACDNQFTSRGGARLFRTPQGTASGLAGYGLVRSEAVDLAVVAAQRIGQDKIEQQVAGALVGGHPDIVEAHQQHRACRHLHIGGECVERHLVVVKQHLASKEQVVAVIVEGVASGRARIDVLGFSVRITDNRFKEPVGIQNVFSPAFLSATTFAVMNETALNQGTHCFYAVGAPALSVRMPNRSLIEALHPNACARFDRQRTDQAGRFTVGHAAIQGG
jgi:hypothetical protein